MLGHKHHYICLWSPTVFISMAPTPPPQAAPMTNKCFFGGGESLVSVVSVCLSTDLFSLFASDLGGFAAREDIEAVLQVLDGEIPTSLKKCFSEVSQQHIPLLPLIQTLATPRQPHLQANFSRVNSLSGTRRCWWWFTHWQSKVIVLRSIKGYNSMKWVTMKLCVKLKLSKYGNLLESVL